MFPKSLYVVLIALVLVTMACGININVPLDEVTTGPTQTESISIPLQQKSETNLQLAFGAGEIVVTPGAANLLVEGTAEYNVTDFKPQVSEEDGWIILSTGNLELDGIPRIKADNIENRWDLKLGSALMNLKINAGAYKGDFELGGLALQSLEINDGAADVHLKFSQSNLAEMSSLRYSTGASTVRMTGLANANFQSMTFRGGAGEYTLDFSGNLSRDASVVVEAGMSEVTIQVPQGTPVRVNFGGGLSDVNTRGDWTKSGDDYILDGSGPSLTITVELGAGTLNLETLP